MLVADLYIKGLALHLLLTHLQQVKVGVHEFADGRPHYAWLPLAGRAAAGSVGGEVRILALRCHKSSEMQCAAVRHAAYSGYPACRAAGAPAPAMAGE